MDRSSRQLARQRWVLPALLCVVAVIIALPLWLERERLDAVEAASHLVDHTNEVRALSNAIAFGLRDLEAAVLALHAGIDTELIRQRIDADGQEIEDRLHLLSALVRDSPEQTARLGALTSRAEQRIALAHQAVAHIVDGDQDAAQGTIREMVTLFPMRETVTEIISAEEALLAPRLIEADRQRAQLRTIGWVGSLVQMVLLCLVAVLMWRQMGHVVRAQGAAREARSHALAILQSVRDPIALVDGRQRLMMHNLAFGELYGDCADGEPLAEAGAGSWNDPAILQRLRDVAGRQRELWDHELTQRTADGVERVMMVNARPMRLPEGGDPVVLLTVADITSHKAAEAQIRELNRQLEGKIEQVSDVNRELEAFSYSVSHDLRAPLRHIAGFADKLGRHLGEEADEKSVHYLGVIGDSARRMSHLIEDLLVYSRLGRNAMRLQPVDMQSLVDEVRAMHDHDPALGPIEWQVAPLPIVVGDENMLRQVWQNLIGNAVKYSSARERIKVRIDCQRQPEGGHRFSVADNGAGFDMQYAGKLFGVFQRLHKASEYPGTGIGLASVRRVLGRHGGRIWAEAAPDQGATFHFTLPASPDPSPH